MSDENFLPRSKAYADEYGEMEEQRARASVEGTLTDLAREAGFESPVAMMRHMESEAGKYRQEHEERAVTDIEELAEILTGREVFEAEVCGLDMEQGFRITFQGDAGKGIPADHLEVLPYEENGIARLSVRLVRTKWTPVENTSLHPPHVGEV